MVAAYCLLLLQNIDIYILNKYQTHLSGIQRNIMAPVKLSDIISTVAHVVKLQLLALILPVFF